MQSINTVQIYCVMMKIRIVLLREEESELFRRVQIWKLKLLKKHKNGLKVN